MANFVYNRAAKRMLNGEILPGTHTFKLMLINSVCLNGLALQL